MNIANAQNEVLTAPTIGWVARRKLLISNARALSVRNFRIY